MCALGKYKLLRLGQTRYLESNTYTSKTVTLKASKGYVLKVTQTVRRYPSCFIPSRIEDRRAKARQLRLEQQRNQEKLGDCVLLGQQQRRGNSYTTEL